MQNSVAKFGLGICCAVFGLLFSSLSCQDDEEEPIADCPVCQEGYDIYTYARSTTRMCICASLVLARQKTAAS